MTQESNPGWDRNVVARLLTEERLTSYRLASGGDLARTLDLYLWNTQACAAVLATIALVEVPVRNAMDQQLTNWAHVRHASPEWFDVAPLDKRGAIDLKTARDRAVRVGGSSVHGKVVAELNFGFWRYLAANRYLTALWLPALARAFPHGHRDLRTRQSQVDHALDRLAFVRNRVAHHEPVHRRNLALDLRTAIKVAGWIDPEVGSWVSVNSPLTGVIAAHP